LQAELGSQRRVDLIVADQNLRDDTSGVEVALKVRESVGRAVPVVMLTAVTMGEVIASSKRR